MRVEGSIWKQIVALILALAWMGAACQPDPIEKPAEVDDVQYKQVEGVDPSLLTLDIYSPSRANASPVVIFIHGGTWTGGDKRNVKLSENLVDFFQRNGAILVSANIRLQHSDLSPYVTYREQAADVASVVRWTRDHISVYGGDPNRVTLFGFSSGSHLVALVGTDESYLRAEGLDLSALESVLCFDVDAYDIPRAIAEGKEYGYPIAAVNLPKYFTSEPETQRAASPMTYLQESKTYPAFLVVYTGYASERRAGQMGLSRRQAELFVEALQSVGATAVLFGDLNLTHDQLIMQFGTVGFGATDAAQQFLDDQFWGE